MTSETTSVKLAHATSLTLVAEQVNKGLKTCELQLGNRFIDSDG